jgi:Universal stress protein family
MYAFPALLAASAVRVYIATLPVLPAGFKDEHLFWKALAPEGGASDIAASIVHYCTTNDMVLCIVGSHGHGAVKRALRSFVGMGSVADYALQNVQCSVCVVKTVATTEVPDTVSAGEPVLASESADAAPKVHEA